MSAELTIGNNTYRFDPAEPIDISIPLNFNGEQPNAYGVPPATSGACVSGELIGDTRRGGSCNFEHYAFIPHCNGTHTECVGHITHERISIRDSLRDMFIPSTLISLAAVPAPHARENYSVNPASNDTMITRDSLLTALDRSQSRHYDALIIRTLPNADAKLTRQYSDASAPYFSTEAMQYIVEIGVRHLLVDLPSIDRLYDEGKLSNHRIFWKIDQGSFELSEIARRDCTITELIYVPNNVPDGRYLLNLQIAPFTSDASPSRPVLFRVAEN